MSPDSDELLARAIEQAIGDPRGRESTVYTALLTVATTIYMDSIRMHITVPAVVRIVDALDVAMQAAANRLQAESN